MERNILLNSVTRQYVKEHALDDVRQLALHGSKDPLVDMPLALQQIQGWQAARRKLPSWADIDGILYPPHLNMEQCSSEQTARYKAKVIDDLQIADLLIDLTGGFGVDFAFMSEGFEQAIYVEQNPELYNIAKANFATLGLANVETVCGDGVDFLHRFDGHASLIFIDPARRDSHGQRTFGIGDCTPDVLPLMDELLAKADHVLLKLSPMLDWRKAISDVGREHVELVHIVAVAGECKELLLLLSLQGTPHPTLTCANDDSKEVFMLDRTGGTTGTTVAIGAHCFLYEPNAALMKAGVFAQLAGRYDVRQLAPNSHLFTSEGLVEHFPGRTFRMVAVSTMNKKELKQKVLPLGQANISVRNFPMSVAELRGRLKLGEGGSNYLFATTLATGERVIIVCQSITR